ncbi:cyclic nucleotide-binding domain-containing protein [Actinoplanes sp. NPDC024001]|uniref:Crp/Fnr family transcriptional regulator n=1 Tax=Actinoplanes sp. NPDC024001 TaxID=3154598 RepID=UPI0033CF4497
MAFLTTFDLLAVHDLVADFPAEWLRRLAICCHPVTYAAGDRLFREEEPATRLCLIHAGVVTLDLHVPGRGDIVVDRLGPGAIAGWESLIPPHRWTFGVVAIEPVYAVEFYSTGIRGLTADEPELGRQLYARLLAKVGAGFQSARLRLAELSAYPPG